MLALKTAVLNAIQDVAGLFTWPGTGRKKIRKNLVLPCRPSGGKSFFDIALGGHREEVTCSSDYSKIKNRKKLTRAIKFSFLTFSMKRELCYPQGLRLLTSHRMAKS